VEAKVVLLSVHLATFMCVSWNQFPHFCVCLCPCSTTRLSGWRVLLKAEWAI